MGLRLDADPFGILPQKVDSVRALRAYASGDSQERLLTFALVSDAEPVSEQTVSDFEAALLRQAWVLRSFSGASRNSEVLLSSARELAPALLLLADRERFDDLLQHLEPGRFERRLSRLMRSLESGAPGTEAELHVDPTGLLRPALAPLASLTSGGGLGEGRALGSRDGRMRLILVETAVPSESTAAAGELMRTVREFRREWLENHENEPVRVLVTGRAAYTAEVGEALFRDIRSTFLGASAGVLLIFWVAFRSLRTLAAVAAVRFSSSPMSPA